MKKILIQFVTIFFILSFCQSVLGEELKILGPDTIRVKAGQPVIVNYSAQGENMISALIDYSHISSGIKLYYEYNSSLYNPPVYIVGYKPGQHTFSVDVSAYVKYFGNEGRVKTQSKSVTVIVDSGKALCINGALDDYSSRKKTFYATIENYSPKTITILSSGAKAINYYKKKNDRRVYIPGKKKIKIGPGKTRTISFKMQGSSVKFDDLDDYVIRCKCKYNKKTYNLEIRAGEPGEALVKIGGKWRNTMLVEPYFYD